jgi:hypothetical protein
MLFARGKVPGANKAHTREQAVPHHDDLVAK